MSDTLNAACWRTHTSRAGLGFKRKNSSPLATETMPASHAHEAEQDAGGVKVVVSADNVSVYSESTLSSGCPEHGRAEEMVRHSFRP